MKAVILQQTKDKAGCCGWQPNGERGTWPSELNRPASKISFIFKFDRWIK